MGEHFKCLSAIFPIIMRTKDEKKQVLLLRRENTGYMDGLWDFAGSGHVDENESAMQAVVRECREELGITVELKDIRFVHLSHRVGQNGARTYYDIYFLVDRYTGEPYIAEPEKCSGLQWFAMDELPEDIIGIRKQAFLSYLKSEYYSEVINF